jgi:FkbM family methyltransferase
MTFISYAQNYEDVILRRAFSDVKKGFYIDVGANDPVIDSVTKAFYDAGWRGINIEPVSEWYEKLLIDRPNDINLQIAAGDREGEVDFYDVIGTGLSTMDKSIAERHVKEHDYTLKSYKVQVTTLSTICKEHPSPDIHFLKIDVEGAEKSVLEGLDLKKFRPWVILIESTLPNSPKEDFEGWESILLTADYEFVYFDGLNRFYVAKEHQEIGADLALPPNVFDNFVLSNSPRGSLLYEIAQIQAAQTKAHEQQQLLKSMLQETENRNKQFETLLDKALANAVLQNELARDKEKELQTQIQTMEETITCLNNEWKAAKHTSEQSEEQLQAVYNSYSWRITWSLRKLLQLFYGLFSLSIRILLWLTYPLKLLTRWFLLIVNSFVLKRPKLQERAQTWLDQHPLITARLQRLKQADSSPDTPVVPPPGLIITDNKTSISVAELSALTPSARRIYHKLQASINERQKDAN